MSAPSSEPYARRYPPVPGHTIEQVARHLSTEFACTCGLPLGTSRTQAVALHRAHKVNLYAQQDSGDDLLLRTVAATVRASVLLSERRALNIARDLLTHFDMTPKDQVS